MIDMDRLWKQISSNGVELLQVTSNFDQIAAKKRLA